MDKIFLNKIKQLFKKKQFNQIDFEIRNLSEESKNTSFILNLKGIVELSNKRIDEAKNFFLLSLKKDKFYLDSLINLARISYKDRDFKEIIELLINYNNQIPNNPKVLKTLSDLTYSAGFIEDAIIYHKKLIKTGSFELNDLMAYIFLQNYSDNYSNKEYLDSCRIMDIELNKKKISFNNKNRNLDKSHIAFLSHDLRDHPVGRFLKDTIKYLKNENFHIIALNLYKDKIEDNKFKNELKNCFSEWHDVYNLNDFELSNFIYEKNISILIDINGYTLGSRLQVLKNKPAPFQISWLGYCNSLGIKEIDYLIADNYVLPKNEEKFYSEKILKLPSIWNVYSKLDCVDVNELPALKNGYLTFGSFNNFSKISLSTINIWSQILLNSPNSRLVLKSPTSVDKNFMNIFLNKFDSKVNKKNIIFLETVLDKKKHLAQFNLIDVSLDPFPYNGVTTSFESIWMGVPVLTLKGEKFVSRCGYSINKNANLNAFIADNINDYFNKAINFGSKDNILSLSKLRKSLREKISSSSLFDSRSFAKNFASILKDI